MSTQSVAAVILIVGSILFLIAASLPISRVFAEPEPAKKLDIIQNSKSSWIVAQFFFASGAVITALGLGLAAILFGDIQRLAALYIAVAAIAVGAVLWLWHIYLRTIDPAAFTSGNLPSWQ